MKSSKSLMVAAAVAGALAAFPLASNAEDTHASKTPSVDKEGCSGKSGSADKGDKESCKGKGEVDKDKSACAGKDGCGGKSM